jgi:hypothetical protein
MGSNSPCPLPNDFSNYYAQNIYKFFIENISKFFKMSIVLFAVPCA